MGFLIGCSQRRPARIGGRSRRRCAVPFRRQVRLGAHLSAPTVALLMADQAFPHDDFAAVAKIGVLATGMSAIGT
jgi:hypothetical protein